MRARPLLTGRAAQPAGAQRPGGDRKHRHRAPGRCLDGRAVRRAAADRDGSSGAGSAAAGAPVPDEPRQPGWGSRQRQCASCSRTKDESAFLREPIEPFQFQRECKECAFGLPLADPSEAGLPEAVRKQRERVRRLEKEFQATSGQARFENTMAHLDECARTAREVAAVEAARRMRDPAFFEERLEGVQGVMGLSRGDTILLVRDQKDLLLLAPDLLAQRLLELRLAVPKANVARLVQVGPWLLLLEDIEGQLRPVLRQMQAVMPSYDVEAKLHEGTGVWWTAADMLRSRGRRFKYA